MTSYIVLQNHLDKWTQLGRSVVAPSAAQAVRRAVEAANLTWTHGEEPEFVAVPARSWKPLRLDVETVTRVRVRPKANA